MDREDEAGRRKEAERKSAPYQALGSIFSHLRHERDGGPGQGEPLPGPIAPPQSSVTILANRQVATMRFGGSLMPDAAPRADDAPAPGPAPLSDAGPIDASGPQEDVAAPEAVAAEPVETVETIETVGQDFSEDEDHGGTELAPPVPEPEAELPTADEAPQAHPADLAADAIVADPFEPASFVPEPPEHEPTEEPAAEPLPSWSEPAYLQTDSVAYATERPADETVAEAGFHEASLAADIPDTGLPADAEPNRNERSWRENVHPPVPAMDFEPAREASPTELEGGTETDLPDVLARFEPDQPVSPADEAGFADTGSASEPEPAWPAEDVPGPEPVSDPAGEDFAPEYVVGHGPGLSAAPAGDTDRSHPDEPWNAAQPAEAFARLPAPVPVPEPPFEDEGNLPPLADPDINFDYAFPLPAGLESGFPVAFENDRATVLTLRFDSIPDAVRPVAPPVASLAETPFPPPVELPEPDVGPQPDLPVLAPDFPQPFAAAGPSAPETVAPPPTETPTRDDDLHQPATAELPEPEPEPDPRPEPEPVPATRPLSAGTWRQPVLQPDTDPAMPAPPPGATARPFRLRPAPAESPFTATILDGRRFLDRIREFPLTPGMRQGLLVALMTAFVLGCIGITWLLYGSGPAAMAGEVSAPLVKLYASQDGHVTDIAAAVGGRLPAGHEILTITGEHPDGSVRNDINARLQAGQDRAIRLDQQIKELERLAADIRLHKQDGFYQDQLAEIRQRLDTLNSQRMDVASEMGNLRHDLGDEEARLAGSGPQNVVADRDSMLWALPATLGMRVSRGTEVARIVDCSRLFVMPSAGLPADGPVTVRLGGRETVQGQIRQGSLAQVENSVIVRPERRGGAPVRVVEINAAAVRKATGDTCPIGRSVSILPVQAADVASR